MKSIEKERRKCEEFLLFNGWEKEIEENSEFTHYNKLGAFSVDIGKDEIVFIGDIGDFESIPINYYCLIGALLEFYGFCIDFKAVK